MITKRRQINRPLIRRWVSDHRSFIKELDFALVGEGKIFGPGNKLKTRYLRDSIREQLNEYQYTPSKNPNEGDE